MKLSPLALVAASVFVTSFAFLGTGCSAASEEPGESSEGAEDVGSVEDELAASRYVGTWDWRAQGSGGFVGLEELALEPGGHYTAMAESSEIVCIAFPCTMAEEGTWSSYRLAGKNKIRLQPAGKPARVYTAVLSTVNRTLTLTRLGQSSKLFKRASISCANVRCASGTHCVDQASGPACVPNNPPPLNPCVKTGCSGQICASQHMVSTCEWRSYYACYQTATCELQAGGGCGWTQTPQLTACLAGNP